MWDIQQRASVESKPAHPAQQGAWTLSHKIEICKYIGELHLYCDKNVNIRKLYFIFVFI
jgi:hypothetical protein